MEIKKFILSNNEKEKFINFPIELTSKPVDNYENLSDFLNNEVKRSINKIESEEKEQYVPFKLKTWDVSVNKSVGYAMNVQVTVNGVKYSRTFNSIESNLDVVTGTSALISAVTKTQKNDDSNFQIKDFYNNINTLDISVNPGKSSDYINIVSTSVGNYSYSYEFKFFSSFYGTNVTGLDQKYYNTNWAWGGFDIFNNELSKNSFLKSMFLLEFFDSNNGKSNNRIAHLILPINSGSSIVDCLNKENIGYYFYYLRDVTKILNDGVELYMRGSFLNAKTGKVHRFMNVKHDLPKINVKKCLINGNALNISNTYGVIAIQTIKSQPHNLNPNDYVFLSGFEDERIDGLHRVDKVYNSNFFLTDSKIGTVNNINNTNLYMQKADFLSADDYNDKIQYFKVKFYNNLTYKIFNNNDEPIEKVIFREMYLV